MLGQAYADLAGDLDHVVVERALHLGHVGEDQTFTAGVDAIAGRVVQTQHHVLRWHDRRLAVGREQDVVRSQHQRACFHLRLDAQRHVDGHLVAVEVGVERRADQRMQLDRLAFNEDRLESLDTEAVQRRCAVQHHRVFLDHFFKDVPDHRRAGFDFLLRRLDGRGNAHRFKTREDERLEQLERHQLRQTALVQLQRRPDHDDRTARVVDTLAQQVLAETTALALDHVGQRLQSALVGTRHCLAAPTVVQQRIDRFLQHALLVAHNDFRRLQFEQASQTVVAVDDAAIQIIEVGGREAATVQRHQRTQVRWQHRQHVHHHPLRLDARLLEGFHHLQALGILLDLQLGAGHVVAQLVDLDVEVDFFEQLLDTLGTHQRHELVTELGALGVVIVLGHDPELLQRGHARVDDHVGFEIQHAFDVAQRHVEHQSQTRRQRLQEPDVGARRRQVDVTHAVTAHLGLRDFNAALLADHATVLQALVLAAKALVVLDRAEDLGAEQPVALRLEGSVVDGLRLLDFAERPAADLLRRGQTDPDGIEMHIRGELLE